MEEINTLCKSFITNKEYQTPDSIVFISGERIQFDLDNFSLINRNNIPTITFNYTKKYDMFIREFSSYVGLGFFNKGECQMIAECQILNY